MTTQSRAVRAALMDTHYTSPVEPELGYECEVVLTDDELVISYDADGHVVYRGKAIGPGHYELFSTEDAGRAVMHCVPGGTVLVGSWRVGSDTGLWKVEITRAD